MTSRVSKLAAAVAALTLAGGGVYWGLGKAHGPESFGSARSFLQTAPVVKDGHPVPLGKAVSFDSADKARVDVFVDGWSARILKSDQLTATVDGKTTDLRLKPVTGADLRELLKQTPKIVADALSRQVSGATDVTCGADGCTIAGKKVDVVRYVTDPSTVPGYGPEYRGWGVKSLLYYASVNAGDGGSAVSISSKHADGGQSLDVPALPVGDTGTAPEAANGYLANRYLVGSAFGRFFLVDPSWTRGAGTARYEAEAPYDAPSSGDEPTVTLHHVIGLNQPWPGTGSFNSTVLTYLTSPTGGCDVGILCVPDRVKTKISNPVHDQRRVCAVVGGQQVSQIAVFDSALITATFPYPTSQFGLWGGKQIDDFGSGVGLLRGGNPPLAVGQHTMRWNTIGLMGGDGQVRAIAGTMGGDSFPADTLTGLLGSVTVDQNRWTPCDLAPAPETNSAPDAAGN